MPSVLLGAHTQAAWGRETGWLPNEGGRVFIQKALHLLCFESWMLSVKAKRNLNSGGRGRVLVSQHTWNKSGNPLSGLGRPLHRGPPSFPITFSFMSLSPHPLQGLQGTFPFAPSVLSLHQRPSLFYPLITVPFYTLTTYLGTHTYFCGFICFVFRLYDAGGQESCLCIAFLHSRHVAGT